MVLKFWCCLSILAVATLVGGQNDDKELYDQLFGLSTKKLSPSETYDYLERFSGSAAKYGKQKTVFVLRNIKHFDSCTEAEADLINKLDAECFADYNLRKYIADVRVNYLEKCSTKFVEMIEKDIDALRKETKEAVPFIKSAIENENNGYGNATPMVSRESVAKALTEFLATRNCEACELIKSHLKVKRSKYDDAYDKYIKTSCREIIRGMRTISKVFNESRDSRVVKAAGEHKGTIALVDSCYWALDRGMPDEVFDVIQNNASSNPNAKKSFFDKLRSR